MIKESNISKLIYNKETGEFFNNSMKKLGCLNAKGYVSLKVNGKSVLAHRLAWQCVYGEIKKGFDIDHINMNRADNRIINLRICTRSQNMQNAYKALSNNKTGIRGVSFDRRSNRYIARIKYDGKQLTIGWFDTKEQAGEAYLEQKRKNHEFNVC